MQEAKNSAENLVTVHMATTDITSYSDLIPTDNFEPKVYQTSKTKRLLETITKL